MPLDEGRVDFAPTLAHDQLLGEGQHRQLHGRERAGAPLAIQLGPITFALHFHNDRVDEQRGEDAPEAEQRQEKHDAPQDGLPRIEDALQQDIHLGKNRQHAQRPRDLEHPRDPRQDQWRERDRHNQHNDRDHQVGSYHEQVEQAERVAEELLAKSKQLQDDFDKIDKEDAEVGCGNPSWRVFLLRRMVHLKDDERQIEHDKARHRNVERRRLHDIVDKCSGVAPPRAVILLVRELLLHLIEQVFGNGDGAAAPAVCTA
mmetsp:Transcript_17645/g.50324  ORF Transcript_17645/g.50324 Transcript_17645/m.50324 type:complete len:259 (-) Transcript_17645:148-924(-)